MRRRKWRLAAWAAAILIAILIVYYNLTTSCPCHSHWYELADMPVYNWILIGLNLAAFSTLLIVKKRTKASASLKQCPHCQACLRPDWFYCPSCGKVKE